MLPMHQEENRLFRDDAKRSNRTSCYGCRVASKCRLRTATRRDIDYHELLPNGEASDLALAPRVPYNSPEAVQARKAFQDGLIPCIPDHIATTLRHSLFSEDKVSIAAQVPTVITETVSTLSIPSSITPDATLDPPAINKPASASFNAVSSDSAMIDFTLTSESFSPPSSDVEAEPTIPVAARVRHPIIPSSDSATVDQIGESRPSPSTRSRPPAPVETVVHVIAINNSKDPRAHQASLLHFQQRRMSVRVFGNQYDGPDFDYGPGT